MTGIISVVTLMIPFLKRKKKIIQTLQMINTRTNRVILPRYQIPPQHKINKRKLVQVFQRKVKHGKIFQMIPGSWVIFCCWRPPHGSVWDMQKCTSLQSPNQPNNDTVYYKCQTQHNKINQ